MGNQSNIYHHYSDDTFQIIDLSWERIFLNISASVSLQDDLSFSIARLSFQTKGIVSDETFSSTPQDTPVRLLDEVSISPCSVSEGIYEFHLNLAIVNNGASFLDNGRWFLIVRSSSGSRLHLASISYDAAYKLSDMDKIFPYGKSQFSYTVHFNTLCFDSVHIIPVLNSRFMIENPDWKESDPIKHHRTLKGKYRCVRRKFKLRMIQLAYDFFAHFNKHDGRHILLMSETKPYLWGNLKYIDERIKSRGLDKELVVDRSFRIAVGKHNSVSSWLKTVRRLAAQDFIFVDDYAPIFDNLDLNRQTKLIQVWHAGVGFKSVGYCRFGAPNSAHPARHCHRKYDYVITGSSSLAEVYSEVFAQPYNRILPAGMARLDNFLDEKNVSGRIAELYKSYPVCQNHKVILFAPTFRGTNQKQTYYNYDALDFDAIYDFCADEYIWAFKMHPFIRKAPPIPEEYSDRIIDLSSVKDINDLYYITDILITDYSSAYYEFSLLNKPILFYTYDRAVYEITKGVHKSIMETAPGKVCDTFEELMTALRTCDYELDKTLAFSQANFGEYDGKASDRIIDMIILGRRAPDHTESDS